MACRTVGSRQIRNHATLAGNVCNASPAADSLAALAVLDARVAFRREGKTLTLPLYDVIERPYHTVLTDRDIVTAIHVRRLPEGTACRFYKLGRRKALAISRMTIAAILHKAADGTPDDFNITVGATFPRPATFPEINALLLHKQPDEAAVEAVAAALSQKIPALAGIRKSTAYKQPVCRNMTARILTELLTEE
jgi:carbon-monoxide dehydrogenase medium subunit/xanthine dehydrogenase FAD-binding subunit